MGPLLRVLVYLALFYLAARAAVSLLRRAASGRDLPRPDGKKEKSDLDRSEIEDAEWEEMDEKGPGRE